MANKKNVVDRWDAVAITNVSKNTPTQQKAIDEWNAMQAKAAQKPAQPGKKTAKKK